MDLGTEEGLGLVRVDHCSFNSFEKREKPVEGEYYAGG